jgi:hypothetical protein
MRPGSIRSRSPTATACKAPASTTALVPIPTWSG